MKKVKKEKKEVGIDRKSVIREALLKVTEEFKPKLIGESIFTSSFDMNKVIYLPATDGLLRDYLKDFKPEDKKIFREVLQDLKNEGIFYHKAANYWVRNE